MNEKEIALYKQIRSVLEGASLEDRVGAHGEYAAFSGPALARGFDHGRYPIHERRRAIS
jgi:hypothetical protein